MKKVSRCWKVKSVDPWANNDGVTLNLIGDDERLHFAWATIALKGDDYPQFKKDDELILDIWRFEK